MKRAFFRRHSVALVAVFAAAGGAFAQVGGPRAVSTADTNQTTVATATTTTTREKVVDTGKAAGHIATQPARDVGVDKMEIPLAVQQAAGAPYSLAGLRTCAQLGKAIFALSDALGPDYSGSAPVRENKAGRLATAGGKTIVNTIIPFRGLVREVSGAAPAERRLNAAIRAAYARRGFLRGVAVTRKCRLA